MKGDPIERIQKVLLTFKEYKAEQPTHIIVSHEFLAKLNIHCRDLMRITEEGEKRHSVQSLFGLPIMTQSITEDFIVL